jgi:3-hydroxyacyl-[acyl-carrier-protein] dehydratase
MIMDVKEIMKHLPHRYPFLLVDRVLEFEEFKSIVGLKNVTMNEEYFQGHFPGDPIMPGVLIIEAMAQTGGILAIKSAGQDNMGVYFMSIEKAKFRKPVVPGDQLRFEVEVIQRRGNIMRLSGKALVDGKAVAETEFTAMMTNEGI